MNERAFPQHDAIANEFHPKYGKDRGMTLRDYFAAKAMQGAIAHGLFNADKASSGYAEYVAHIAYVYADEMLKVRGK